MRLGYGLWLGLGFRVKFMIMVSIMIREAFVGICRLFTLSCVSSVLLCVSGGSFIHVGVHP